MKKLLISLPVLIVFLVSCEKEEVCMDMAPETYGDIRCVDGHLDFASSGVLESYMTALAVAEDTDDQGTRLSPGIPLPPGFTSISQRKRNMALTRAGNSDEMTPEEFEIMKAENLLVDPALLGVMDTNLVIGVENRIYKVTDCGTFSVNASESGSLPDVIRNFDRSRTVGLDNGESIELGGSALFTNTFGPGSVDRDLFSLVGDTGPGSVPFVQKTVPFSNDFHIGYGTVDYEWKNRSLWQKLWDSIRGKDVSREEEFDDSHRVRVSLYDVNYLFYATTGIKCEMQRQKRFLFVKYWVSDEAEDMVIGFNKVYGKMKFTNPRSYSNISPLASTYWSMFTGRIDGITSEFIHGITKLDILRNWVNDKIFVCIPSFPLAGKTYKNTDIGNKLFDAAENLVFGFLKSQAGRYSLDIETGVRKQIQPKDPRAAYFVWGESTIAYDEEKPFIMGVRQYGAGSSRTATFDTSFGFSINISNGRASLPGGFLPTEFDIEEIDAFGAAKYGGRWKGVRFVSQ